MNNLDEICEEAWERIIERKLKYDLGERAQFDSDCIAIIKSACEKETEQIRKQMDFLAKDLSKSRAAHRVKKDAAGASDDNCRQCGRPLGWFEPGLCDDCRAVQAREHRVEHRGKHIDIEYFGAAHRVEKDAAGASEQWKLCECGHLDVDHRREKDHDECTVGECECDRLRLEPAGANEQGIKLPPDAIVYQCTTGK